MITVVLVIHILIAIALVGIILLQKSEGGALGIGGGGGMSGFMHGRSKASLLTRTTAILACGFIVTSLTLAKLAGTSTERTSIIDEPASIIDTEQNDTEGPSAPLSR